MTLFDAVSVTIRRLHYSPRTEEAYLRWVRDFVRFHHRRHPREMGAAELTACLDDLAVRRRCSASTQKQALCALVFLHRRVLDLDLPALAGLDRARRPEHLPDVLSRRDVLARLDRLDPPYAFSASSCTAPACARRRCSPSR
jgi:integrase